MPKAHKATGSCIVTPQNFCVTVSKTVRRMLSDRSPVCLSCLSVTLVHCGQTVEWIKMKLGTQVGLGPGHIVLDRDPAAPPQKGAEHPNIRPMSVVSKRLDGPRCTWHGCAPRSRPHCTRWGPSYPLPQKGAEPPIFGPRLLWPNGCMY